MRILLLLVVLAVIGLTLARWLDQPPKTAPVPPNAATTAPAVPTRPQDLKAFERDINRFMQDTATQRNREADPP